MDYDEDRELTRYVWNHYERLMTEFERRVGRSIIARWKMERAGTPESAAGLARAFRAGGQEVEEALAEGAEAYRRRVRDRVLTEHGPEVFVNRCPGCGRVVRTPQARQCFWCGCDWHAADEAALLSEAALAEWNTPEEDAAWSHLQPPTTPGP